MKCTTCDGCGRIANDDEGVPWTHWERLPFEAKVAVRMGLVQPIPCPVCNGKGECETQTETNNQTGGGENPT